MQFPEVKLDSSFPYPPSSNSASQWHHSLPFPPYSPTMNSLKMTLAALSEAQLRDVVLRIANHDPYFCDIIAMELGDSLPCMSDSDDNTSPTTPTIARHRPRSRRRKFRHQAKSTTMSNTLIHFPPAINAESDQEECCYHPGHLETEDYEFHSLTPEGQAYRVIQTVSMWSCCEGEDKSPGCAVAPAHLLQHVEPAEPPRTRMRSKLRPMRRRGV